MMRKQFQNFIQAMLSLQNATETNKHSYCSARCYQLFSRFQKHPRDATNRFLFNIKNYRIITRNSHDFSVVIHVSGLY